MLAVLFVRKRSEPPAVEHPIELTAESLWTEVSSRLREALNETTYKTWFGDARALDLTDDRFVIAVPNDFAKTWIRGHFLELIRAAVTDCTGTQRRVVIAVRELPQSLRREDKPRVAVPGGGGLNPKYTFDSFVIGSSNRFAHAAALVVAEAPAQNYNPLFIYGETGLGKTHLLQAIAHYVAEHAGNLTVCYVTSETFM